MVVEYQHVKPGKGAAFVRTKLRNVKTELNKEVTFKTDDKIEEAFIEERHLRFLYRSGEFYHFMDQENYEEVAISQSDLKDTIKFLKEEADVSAYTYKNQIVRVAVPNFIVFKITESEPGIKGDTAKSGTKPAKIETGATIQVPLFVNVGDRIKVDTRSGQYVERA